MCLVFVTKSAAAVAAAPWSRPGLGLGPGTTTGDDSSGRGSRDATPSPAVAFFIALPADFMVLKFMTLP